MTSAQRRNAKMELLFERARQIDYEIAAKAAGWERRDSHFTRCGVSIAYVDWKTLCIAEGIPVERQA